MSGPIQFEARLAEAEAEVKRKPNDLEAVVTLALFKTHARRFAEAAALLAPIYHENQANRRVLEVYAGALFGGARYREAADPLTRLVEIDGENLEYRRLLTQALNAIGYADRAIDVYRPVFQKEPDSLAKYLTFGTIHFLAGKPREGERLLQKALALAPGNADALTAIAQCRVHLGEIEAAKTLCFDILKNDPGHVRALSLLADIDPKTFPSHFLAALKSKAEAAGVPAGVMISLNFTLGKVLLARGEADAAYRHFSQANELSKKILEAKGAGYDHNLEMKKFAAIQGLFSRDVVSSPPGLTASGPTPVFIFGLPRSGTTLVEQILSAHPRVFGAGEPKALGEIYLELDALARGRPHADAPAILRQGRDAWSRAYLERLGPVPAGVTHITDKMPLNFPYIGLARFLFPNARFICVRRDPQDTCVSMFTQPLDDSYPAAVDFVWLGQFYNLFETYMTWWDALVPGDVLRVRYEDIVKNQEAATRAMLEFLGLEGDDACLAFSANPRVVTTLSNVQVRQPLSAESIGRWRAFEPHVGPLIRSLGVHASVPPPRRP